MRLYNNLSSAQSSWVCMLFGEILFTLCYKQFIEFGIHSNAKTVVHVNSRLREGWGFTRDLFSAPLSLLLSRRLILEISTQKNPGSSYILMIWSLLLRLSRSVLRN